MGVLMGLSVNHCRSLWVKGEFAIEVPCNAHVAAEACDASPGAYPRWGRLMQTHTRVLGPIRPQPIERYLPLSMASDVVSSR
jgi:hypothetical protein